ncbi:MAG: MarR family winged helix-turn-helix transcriptional regulator [Hyphomicrobiaceae bacterium]
MIEQSEKAFLNERLTFRLDVLAQEAISANDAIFVKAVGCTIREVRVLRLIDDFPGITFIEICRATGLERSLASRIIRRLIAIQLVRRENDASDARRFGLSTTALGKDRRTEARALSDNLEITLCSPLSAGERKQLNNLLDRLALWVRSAEYKQALAEHETADAHDQKPRKRRKIIAG